MLGFSPIASTPISALPATSSPVAPSAENFTIRRGFSAVPFARQSKSNFARFNR